MMMFGALFKKAEATVDNAINGVVDKIIIAVPFIVAVTYATIAGSNYAVRMYGAEIGNLIVAGVFLTLGLMTAMVVSMRGRNRAAAVQPTAARREEPAVLADSQAGAPMSDADRELMAAALTSAAPIALPAVLRLVFKNLPLILAILAAAFVMTRPSPSPEPEAEAV